MVDTQTDMGQTKNQPSSLGARLPTRIASTLATIAGGILAVATLIGFFLHLSGDVAHSTYLTEMGIPEDLFPKATDAKIIHGYYIVIAQGSRLISDIPWRIAVMMIFFSTLFIIITRIPSKERTPIRGWLERQPYWVKQPIAAALVSIIFLSAAVCVGFFVLLLAIVPGLVGEKFGKNTADETKRLLCANNSTNISELWKGAERLAEGRIIATSENLIAIYDNKLKAMRILRRDSIEIRNQLPIATSTSSASPHP